MNYIVIALLLIGIYAFIWPHFRSNPVVDSADQFYQEISSPFHLEAINEKSSDKLQVIYKHSTRCGLCHRVIRNLQREWNEELAQKMDVYYVDVIQNRFLSNVIANDYGIIHQSPQLLVIQNGKCVYNASHTQVSFQKALDQLK